MKDSWIGKKILYLDMDGVVADFDAEIKRIHPNIDQIELSSTRSQLVDEVAESNPTLFENLNLIEGAKDAVIRLNELYEVYFLSTPMWNVPESFMGKRLWLAKTFGELATKKLILTHRKDLNIGHYLVDDRLKNGAADFSGMHIHFRTPKFPDWATTMMFLEEAHDDYGI